MSGSLFPYFVKFELFELALLGLLPQWDTRVMWANWKIQESSQKPSPAESNNTLRERLVKIVSGKNHEELFKSAVIVMMTVCWCVIGLEANIGCGLKCWRRHLPQSAGWGSADRFSAKGIHKCQRSCQQRRSSSNCCSSLKERTYWAPRRPTWGAWVPWTFWEWTSPAWLPPPPFSEVASAGTWWRVQNWRMNIYCCSINKEDGGSDGRLVSLTQTQLPRSPWCSKGSWVKND